jgi:predicted phosphodiesterase
MAERFQRTRATIGELVLEQLKRLPERLRIPLIDGCEVVMVHGSPADATLEISHDLDDAEIVALVQDDPADWVMCGSTHVPFLRELDGVHVVNLGSVGDAPEGRVAHFTILTPRMDGTQLLQTWVEY